MAWRQLHDDVPHSRTLGRLSDPAERLYMRMLSQTDQWGRLPGDPEKIRTVCIPTLAWDDDKLHRALTELERSGAIDRYSTAGAWTTQLVNFDERQAFPKQRRQPSRYPARTLESLSPSDLAPPLPLLDAHAGVEPGACGPSLSNGDLRNEIQKTPASTGEHRQKTEDRRESDLPTAVARAPANGLSVSHTLEESLTQATHPHGLALVPIPDLADATGDGLSADGFARLPAGELGDEPGTPQWLLARLRNSDGGTLNVLEALRKKGLSPADFLLAAEMLSERQPPPKSDVRYVMGVLNNRLRERREGAAA